MAGKFTRFSEKRDTAGSDVTTYDDVVEGIEPEESSGLHIPIAENNMGFRLIQKMGWKSGMGLGRKEQGRINPVPLELKDDFMGLGRFQQELDLATEATEKRKQLEIEKQLTPGLIDKYKAQVVKEQLIADSTSELRKSYYCELCDKQYSKYSEYDNHLNSYDHHHRQRLKDLRQYEAGRKFGGHKNVEEKQQKTMSAQVVALERAQMRAQRRVEGGNNPSFKPFGYRPSKSSSSSLSSSVPSSETSSAAITSALRKRSGEEIQLSEKKIAEKKARLAKYGVKFQSAGHLATINDQSDDSLSSYQSNIFSTNLKNDTGPSGDKITKGPSNKIYLGHFVSPSVVSKENEVKKDDEEREKRLQELPHAIGRKAEQLTALEATKNDSNSDDDEDFTMRYKRTIPSQSLQKVVTAKLPVKQLTLKLTDKYESYYH